MPKSLIRFSSIVEDSIGCPYCLDEKDLSWLAEFNKQLMTAKSRKDGSSAELQSSTTTSHTPILSEDYFEQMLDELEKVTEAKRKEV